MIKMFKTIIKAIFYIVITAIVLSLAVAWVRDLIVFYLNPETEAPFLINVVNGIMQIPILNGIVRSILNVLT